MAVMIPELKYELPQTYIESQVKLAEEVIHKLCRQEGVSGWHIEKWMGDDDTYCIGLCIAIRDADLLMALNQALEKLVLESNLDFTYATPVIFTEG